MAYNPNSQWKRKTITIAVPTSSLPAGYQVKLTIPKETEIQPDFRDLRFETTDGYGLPYWIESIISNTATVWVKLKDSVTAGPSSTVDIYMYYGNPYVASTSSGTNTFPAFDDFSTDTTANYTEKYYATWSPMVYKTISGGEFHLGYNIAGDGSSIVYGNQAITNGSYALRAKFRATGKETPSNFRQQKEIGLTLGTVTPAYYASCSTGADYTGWASNLQIPMPDDIGQTTEISGSTTSEITYNLDNNNYYIGFFVQDVGSTGTFSSELWIDFALVRKYVATEPATPTISLSSTTVNWNPQRKKITINTTTATPANYQVRLTIPFAPEMNNDFSDLRFVTKAPTPVNLDYWIESSAPGVTADIWVELADSIGASSSDYIYMHYGNPDMTSASNGYNTFLVYSDGNDVASWTNSVTNVNGELHFAWSGASASTKTVSVSKPWIIEARFRSESITNQNFLFIVGNGSGTSYSTNRNIQAYQDANTTTWNALSNGSNNFLYSSMALSTYYILKEIEINTSNYNHYLYNANRSLLGSVIGTTYGYTGQVDPITAIQFGSNSGAYYINSYVTWVFVRKYIATEPTIDYTAAVEAMNIFSNRKALTINNSTGLVLTDYQVPITVTYAPSMQANFNDIRFVDYNGNLLPYWLESKTDSTTANFWIKLNLQTGNNTVYMYYGNPNLTSVSSGTNTFIQFSDFSNSSGLTLVGGWHISNGMLSISSGTWATSYFTTTINETQYVIYAKARINVGGARLWLSGMDNYPPTDTGATGMAYYMPNPSSWPNYLFRYNNGNPYTAGGTNLVVVALGTWAKYKLTIDTVGNNYIAYVDNLLGSTASTSYSTKGSGTSKQVSFGAVGTEAQDYDHCFVCKYASAEPTVSVGAEETPSGIGATSMIITPSENPCRTGICTVTVDVIWTNGSLVPESFIPSIKLNGTPVVVAPPLTTVIVNPSGTASQQFIISGLSPNSYSICPDPN